MLLPQTELKLFFSQINLILLNDIIAFVLSTSEATYTQKRALSKHCIFLDQDADGGAVQAKYGFLYLGELLERYEERFGASIQDLRAIALALGYTKEITTDAMFIGSQRTDFLRKLNRMADGDLYLTGAVYLLADEDKKNAIESKLIHEYSTIEGLIFAASLLQDSETVFPHIKGQLLRLLGNGHTVSVLSPLSPPVPPPVPVPGQYEGAELADLMADHPNQGRKRQGPGAVPHTGSIARILCQT